MPWWDMWDYWVWYLKPHPSLIVKLFAQHNEHRIAVARLFFLADQLLFHGRAISIFVSIFLVQFLHAALLWRLAFLAHPFRKTLSVFLGSAAFVCLFSAEQYTNFTWSFQIQFVAVYFAATGALASLMIYAGRLSEELPSGERRPWMWLGITILAGFIATYSMANGLLLWPILALEAFWFGLPRRAKVTLVIAWLTAWALYLWGYQTPPQTSSIREGFHNLPQSFAFAMCVLGSPLNDFVFEIDRTFSIGSGNWQLVWSAVAGLAGFVYAAFLWITYGGDRRQTNRADAVILHLMLFLIATILLIGLGRSNFPLQDAVHSRYTTPALLFWFCLLCLTLPLLTRNVLSGDRPSFMPFQFVTTVIVFMVIVLYQPTQLREARTNALNVSEYEASIGALVYDPDLWAKRYYNPRALVPVLRYMQAKHLSVFAPERLSWIGDPITSHYHVVPTETCVGIVDDNAKAFPDTELPGFRLSGWAWNPHSRRIARSIVITDKPGRILGFGYPGFDRPDVRATRWGIGPAVGWIAYIPGLNHEAVAAYMVTGDGDSACLVGSRALEMPVEELRAKPE